MRKTVVIVGGGVAGMSAAHELLEKSGHGVDFHVRIFEKSGYVGGKARSIPVPRERRAAANGTPRSTPVPRSAQHERRDLPGEHGFRFFPGFYRHLPATLERIPARGGGSVLDQLVQAPRLELARANKPSVVLETRFPRTAQDLFLLAEDAFADLGVSRSDIAFYASRIWQIITSCDRRSVAEYEKVTWWEFVEAEKRSPAFRELLAEGVSRSLLANDPKLASARTVGTTNARLLLTLLKSNASIDRVLNGPTTEVWLEPWLDHLKGNANFEFHFDAPVTRIHAGGGRVTGITVSSGDRERRVEADYYVFALPIERMAELMKASASHGTANLVELDPSLGGILELDESVAWMNGIQFFLYRPVPIVSGHCLFVDSPWSLTAIAEGQFWKGTNLATRGDGTVRDVLSVCISNWDAPGLLYGRPARELTHEQIEREVWLQLKTSLNVDDAVVLRDEDLHSSFLDPDIIATDPAVRMDPQRYNDMEPLFINAKDTWRLRPTPKTAIPNVFLAADYVQTRTDVACMESANEAARRAVNAMLEVSESSAPPCKLWNLDGPTELAPLRWLDELKFKAHLTWSFPLPFGFRPDGGHGATGPAPTGGLPPYVVRSAEQTNLAPYACKGTRLFGFLVKGSVQAIQQNVVDPWLNACSGGAFGFRALSDLLMVTFTDATELRSLSPPDSQKGFTPERSCVVWIPIISIKGTPKLYFFPSYIIVDNPWSMATGREVHGFPKELGTIVVPKQGSEPTEFVVSTLVLRQFATNESTRQATILDVRRTETGGGDSPWATDVAALRHIVSLWITERHSSAIPSWDLVRALVETIEAGALPLIFLKQFRDAADGTRACFQALVEARSSVTAFRGGAILPGRFDLGAASFASHPLARDLGIGEGRVPVEVPFFIDFDFTLGTGKEIWRGS